MMDLLERELSVCNPHIKSIRKIADVKKKTLDAKAGHRPLSNSSSILIATLTCDATTLQWRMRWLWFSCSTKEKYHRPDSMHPFATPMGQRVTWMSVIRFVILCVIHFYSPKANSDGTEA